MSHKRSLNAKSSKPVMLVLVSALAIAASGCSSLPTAPVDATDMGATGAPKVMPIRTAVTWTWNTIATRSFSKGEAGTLSGGRYQIQFVRGSLGSSLLVSISERDPAVADVVLGPSPTVLAKAATLTIDYAGSSLELSADFLKLYRLNPVTGAWEVVAGMNDVVAKKFSAKVSFLCRYALSPTDPTKAGW